MTDPTPTHATEKTFRSDRHEPNQSQVIADLMRQNQELTILTDGMEAEIDAVHYQKSRLIARLHERAREVSGLREQVNDLEILSGELTQARATIAILREEAKFLRQSVKQEIANRNLAADEYWKCINDLTRQRDELRATIAEQAKQIADLKPLREKINERWPVTSSRSDPDPRPIVECCCDLCNVSFGRRAGDVIECPACHGHGMNQRLVLR